VLKQEILELEKNFDEKLKKGVVGIGGEGIRE